MTAKVRLGDIATVVTKGTTPTTIGFQFEDSGINFVKIESISEDGTFLKEKFSHISDECNVQMRRSHLQENDILFSIAGAIGRSAIVTKEILPANTNQALAIIRVPKGKIDYNYLLYALSSSAINQQATQHQQGVAQLNISLKNVSDFLLPIYTEAMQKRIVHNLKKIDKLISLRKQQLAKLDELVKARFVEMFGNPVSNTMGWKSEQLVDCLQGIDNGKSFVCFNDTRQGQEPAMLKLSAVTYGVYNQKENKVLLDDTMFIKAAEVHRGDLLFTRKNTPELVGRCAYVTNTEPNLMMPDLIFRLNPNDKINAIFLWKLINHELFREKIQNIATGSAKSMSNISKERLGKLKIIIPPIPLQNQFAAFVERIDQQKQTVQQSLEKLELMKKALMQEYFG